MHFIGVDLHKQVISVCVLVQTGSTRRVVARRTLRCDQPDEIEQCFAAWRPFQIVVEATSSFEWFVRLLEPLAERIVLAHPKKLRIIAESTKKTDRLDAQVLAEFLALDMIPAAHRASPRLREYRALVRQRQYVQRRITSLKNRLRHLLSHSNADVKHLFSEAGQIYLDQVKLSPADRFVVEQLREGWRFFDGQLTALDRRLRQFARLATLREREARAALATIPCVGSVTIDVVLSELGDIRRFRSAKQVAAYAGLAPGIRESAGRGKQLGITKQGSGLLRWALVETAWRMVSKTRRWGLIYEQLKRHAGSKKAIVAVARRILGVMVALLRAGGRYRLSSEAQT